MGDNLCCLMREVQQQAFVVMETKLFLDTHPDCAEAMKVFACACEKLEATKRLPR